MNNRPFALTGFLTLVIVFACMGGFVGCDKSNTTTVKSTPEQLESLAEKMRAEEEASLAERASREGGS